ncbi:chaperone protein dnaJ 49 [Artemisia annua]|uniref:Chaperone protein dnaJ 49 n=1 Tax=Artemisia annua TaxID=35608 RepID=A0A2U1P214_ARTAN|nr:chaperone protein dnaJ 49 [Artemisia annua]
MDARINIASAPPLPTQPTTSNATQPSLVGPVIFLFTCFIIGFVFFAVMVSLRPRPLYSITTHGDYEFPMMTMTTEPKIKYYVKSPDEFDKKYPNDTPAREHVENQIVGAYLKFARKRCNYEEKQHLLRPDFPTPICDRLVNVTIQS